MDRVDLTTQIRYMNGVTSVIEIVGDVTGQSEDALTEAFNQVTSHGARNILLDFSQLDYMNSSGIGLLVTLFDPGQTSKPAAVRLWSDRILPADL